MYQESNHSLLPNLPLYFPLIYSQYRSQIVSPISLKEKAKTLRIMCKALYHLSTLPSLTLQPQIIGLTPWSLHSNYTGLLRVPSTGEACSYSGPGIGCSLCLEYPLFSYPVRSKLYLPQVFVHTFSLILSLATLFKIAIPLPIHTLLIPLLCLIFLHSSICVGMCI